MVASGIDQVWTATEQGTNLLLCYNALIKICGGSQSSTQLKKLYASNAI